MYENIERRTSGNELDMHLFAYPHPSLKKLKLKLHRELTRVDIVTSALEHLYHIPKSLTRRRITSPQEHGIRTM